jgi:uncharacterized protein YcfL
MLTAPSSIEQKDANRSVSLVISLLCVVFFSLTLGACTTQKATELPRWHDRVSVDSDILGLKVIDVFENFAPDGTPIVIFVAQSSNISRQSLRLRALWFDSTGTPMRTAVSNWQQRTLESGQKLELRFVGPSVNAQTYRIEVQKNPT